MKRTCTNILKDKEQRKKIFKNGKWDKYTDKLRESMEIDISSCGPFIGKVDEIAEQTNPKKQHKITIGSSEHRNYGEMKIAQK